MGTPIWKIIIIFSTDNKVVARVSSGGQVNYGNEGFQGMIKRIKRCSGFTPGDQTQIGCVDGQQAPYLLYNRLIIPPVYLHILTMFKGHSRSNIIT